MSGPKLPSSIPGSPADTPQKQGVSAPKPGSGGSDDPMSQLMNTAVNAYKEARGSGTGFMAGIKASVNVAKAALDKDPLLAAGCIKQLGQAFAKPLAKGAGGGEEKGKEKKDDPSSEGIGNAIDLIAKMLELLVSGLAMGIKAGAGVAGKGMEHLGQKFGSLSKVSEGVDPQAMQQTKKLGAATEMNLNANDQSSKKSAMPSAKPTPNTGNVPGLDQIAEFATRARSLTQAEPPKAEPKPDKPNTTPTATRRMTM